jgi:acyl-CoA synthetase (AMP-forming)/AMP-acid ligase II
VGGEGFETKVVDHVLWIRSESAMLGYLNAPSPFDSEGWFNTQDVVDVDGEYLRILGRQTEIINIGGEKVYPAEVEGVLLGMDHVADVAVRGERNLIMGQVVLARLTLLRPEGLDSLKRRVREYCRDKLPRYAIPARIEISDQLQSGPRFKKIRTPIDSSKKRIQVGV